MKTNGWPKNGNILIHGDANLGKSLFFLLYFWHLGLRGYKIRHDRKFNDPYEDGMYHFAYSDDWDFSKTIEWLCGFTDPSLNSAKLPACFEDEAGFLKGFSIRNPGGTCTYKTEPLLTILVANKSPEEGWPDASD